MQLRRKSNDDSSILLAGNSMKTLLNTLCFVLVICVLLPGCEVKKKVADKAEADVEKPEADGEQVEADGEKPKAKKGSIFGKKTQDITEYDPAAGKVVSEGKYESSLIKSAMGNARVYGSAVENIEVPRVTQLLEMHRAVTGEYPKTFQEFMDEIILKNNHKLTMLPHGSSYQYDVKNHKLIVVKDKAEE